MKIAVCLSGQMRTYRKCAPSLFDNLIKKHDCDVFISTWEDLGKYRGQNSKKVVDELDTINNLYNNPILKVEKAPPPKIEGFDINKIGNKYYMFYLMHSSNELCRKHREEHNVKYDFVIRSRPDIIFNKNNKVDFDNLNKEIAYTSPGFRHEKTGKQNRAWEKSHSLASLIKVAETDDYNDTKNLPKLAIAPMNDQVAIGSPEDMDIYSGGLHVLLAWLQNRTGVVPPFSVRHPTSITKPHILLYQMWVNKVSHKTLDSIDYSFIR